MPRQDTLSPPAPASALPAASGRHWRSLLEARWQARLQEVTELSLAYHDVAETVTNGNGSAQERLLLRRAAAARRKLADVEDALGRLAAGQFGSCEQCGSAIQTGLLILSPETRYCLTCA
jgi:RNA polymerase-binding transcription factor DksA